MSASSSAALLRRSLRLLSHRARGAPLPFSITFILTHRCNFQCSYCDVPSAAGDEMTAAEYRRAIDELCEAGLARASFSGGEAFLRREACEIIAHAKRRRLVTSLNTNAWLAERHLAELAGVLDVLVVSLDGPEHEHDLVRRQPGSYARVVRVLEKARALGIGTATITVLSRENLHVVDDVLSISRRLGSFAYFQPAYRACFDRQAGLQPELHARILGDVSTRLRASKRAGLPVGASSAALARLERAPHFGRCEKCHAGRYFGTVMPDGTVVPCHLTSGAKRWPNGREIGFAAAFRAVGGAPPGDGCAISPYQEADLVFGGDLGAARDAFVRFFRR